MEFTLKSGAKLSVSPSPFGVANELRKAIMRLIVTEEKLKDQDIAMLSSDSAVENHFFVCAEKAIYEGAKVTPALFDEAKLGEQARTDYFEIFAKVLEVNFLPFFRRASSASEIRSAPPENGQG